MTTQNTPPIEQVDTDRLLQVEQLAAELVKRQAAIAADVERIAEIKTILRDTLPVGTHPAGDYKVQVKAGARRLDTKALADAYPVAQHPELYTATPDTAKVKAHLAPVVLDGFYAIGAPTVVVS